ncbi:glycosyltransferase family 2 protein [Collinsella sp. LCP19S3_C6]|uniref:glycosyltransferase family 2 protein n=1 Tax=unclassified Collinsella TaxID=2637548 RepID=UPI003F93D68F
MSRSLSIIVLVYNSAEDAQVCVDKLLSFEFPLQVVIVDNCSPDGSFVALKERYKDSQRVDVIQTDVNRGYSAGNNCGIRYAMERYGSDSVAVMNPDVLIPDEKMLLALLDLLWSSDNVLAVGGQPINHLEGDSIWPSSWSLPTPWEVVANHCLLRRSELRDNAREIAPGVFSVDCIVGCFFIAKAGKFSEVGLLDEGVFLYNEENILGKKCKAAGLRLLVDKSQTYYHNHSPNAVRARSLKSRLSSARIGYKSRQYLARTYYSPLLSFPLCWVEMINELEIVLGWLLHDAFRYSNETVISGNDSDTSPCS